MAERQHFASVLRAYDNYEPWAQSRIARLERDLSHLSEHHRQIVRADEKIAAMRTAVQQNARVLKQVVGPHRTEADVSDDKRQMVLVEGEDGRKTFRPAASQAYVPESDMEKLQSTIKQFVREWGSDGAAEREQAHAPVLEALRQLVPVRTPSGEPARVLVPGAGLGRLAWEAARLGYTSQASEFSYFMLIAANFVLNALQHVGPIQVHPWALATINQPSRAEQLRAVTVPDVAPWSLPADANFSMCAGDFLEVYRDQAARWEALLTLFFIDTAHDVTAYLLRISELLVPGGVWINMGPLLWHYSDNPHELSVDLTWDELRPLILDFGFVLEREEWRRCRYTNNPASLYQMEYQCIFFVARWPGMSKGAQASAGAEK